MADLKGRVTAQTRTRLADITTEADGSGLESEGRLADIATWRSTDASLSTHHDDPGPHSHTTATNDRRAIVNLPPPKTGLSTNLVRDLRGQIRRAELD